MTGADFLSLATMLFAPYRGGARPIGEPLGRTITSRCYYGAYHLSVSYLRALNLQTGSDHGMPPKWFKSCSEPNAKEVGDLLADLYSARVRADYDLEKPRATAESLDAKLLEQKISWAYRVDSLLKNCMQEPTRSIIKAEIESFQRRTKR